MRVKFHQNLDDLKEKLLIMAGMAEQAITRSIEAYRTRDLSICELVLRAEPSINRLEREIDQMALDLLAMEQPMAIDLRFILSVIRINADLERVGDQAVNIAIRVREMGAFANVDLPSTFPSSRRSRLRWCARRSRRSSKPTPSWQNRCFCWTTRWMR